MIIMFINKYSVLAFSMILACLQAATEQYQLDIALALSKAEHEAELKRKDDIELQKAIEEQNIQKALQDDLETRNSKAAAGYHENEDRELQQAIAESMQTSSARSSGAPLSEADLEARAESQFQKEKREIEIEIQGLEEIDVNTTVTIVKDRPKRRSEINARLYVLRNQLQNYTIPGKITAKKMQIKRYIAAQR
jgi:HD superfamily phosphohydrolase